MVGVVLILIKMQEAIMPGRDRTGPNSLGAMTGRHMGFCANTSNQYYSNRGMGFGRGNRAGMGLGRGYGLGNRNINIENNPNISNKTLIENEIRILKDQLSSLED